ncbi:MAG: 30S ribosomal protein S4 [Candidatus Jordarchaeales archaeon]
MGDIKRSKKKYITPRKPWDKERLHKEITLVGKYGLRNKRELWRAQAILRGFRERARKAMALPQEEREKQRKEIVSKLYRWGILPPDSTLDDVLALTVENFLDRRLQTLVVAKGLAKSVYQARQLITHGHIAVAGRRVTRPSYIVDRMLEDKIDYAPTSPLKNSDHPIRKALTGA